MSRLKALSVSFALLFLFGACVAQSVPAADPVVVVALENQSYESVVGSSAMPYLNSLIQQGTLTTNFYANTHGSLADYFLLTTGEMETLEDGYNARVSINNLARRVNASGKNWKSYAQSLPYAGFLGDQYPYAKRHNPFAYFTDVIDNSAQQARIVPFTQFATDLAGNSLPDFSFIVPDLKHDAHDCPAGGTNCTNDDKLRAADQFLADNLPALLASAAFQQNGLLVIWWDEGGLSDGRNGGGRIAVTLLGPKVKKGYATNTSYRHEHLARTIFQVLGLSTNLSTIFYATPMADVFTGAVTGSGTITGQVTSIHTGYPLGGATVSYSGGSTTTNSSGYFTLNNVAAGTYVVTASLSGWLSRSQTVTVTSSTTTTANFQLSTAGKITGTVYAPSGTVIAGATVSFSGGVIPTSGTVKTGSNGTYDSNWVPTGSYTVTVSASGYQPQTKTTTVSTGVITTLNFTLSP
jgi:phosphatidylinositol-3-phosphatase